MSVVSVPPTPPCDRDDWTRNGNATEPRIDGNAFRGLKRGVRGFSRFSAFIFFASVVIAAAAVLRCDLTEWCILIGAIGLVLTTELGHGAIQSLARTLDASNRVHVSTALDMASAAGLVATATAILVATAIFLKHLNVLTDN